MPNVFTSIQPVLFEAAQQVSQEPIGLLTSIDLNFNSEKPVALGDTVYVPYAGVGASSSFTPAATAPEGTASTAASVPVQIQAIDQVSWNMTGEQILSLENASMNQEWIRQKVAQAMRKLRNNAEAALGVSMTQNASRAYGTSGTSPFNASTLVNITAIRKELRKNGAPQTDLKMVFDLEAEEALLNLGVLQNYYQAGTAEQLRQGVIVDKMGFEIKSSANIASHTKGTGTGYAITASAAVGDTTLTVSGGNSGTILAGDYVTFAGTTDANKYVVNNSGTATAVSTGTASGAAAGTITIGRPGMKVIRGTDAMTIGNTYTGNLAFHKYSTVGIIRVPQMPANPTIASTVISDEFGCSYLLCDVAQWGQRSWIMIMAYGFRVVQSEHVMILLG